MFIFACEKNNYRFDIFFNDDNIYLPGILSIDKIIDTNNNQIITCHCNLFYRNTDVVGISDIILHTRIIDLENVLRLLDSNSYDDYIMRSYDHFRHLPSLLENSGFKINDCKTTIKDSDLSINTDIFTFYISVTNSDNDSCIIIPQYNRDDKKYSLFICPTITQINEMYYSGNKNNKDSFFWVFRPFGFKRKLLDLECFIQDMLENFYNISYESLSDYNNVLKCIDTYFKYKKGSYGYYENDRFYNEKDIVEMLKSYSRINYTYAKYMNIGPVFGIYIIVTPCDQNSICDALSFDRLTNKNFPYDMIGIHFSYDTLKDNMNCVLDIEHISCDLIEVAKDYDLKSMNRKKRDTFKYEYNWKKHDKCIFKGSFTKLNIILNDFISNIDEHICKQMNNKIERCRKMSNTIKISYCY